MLAGRASTPGRTSTGVTSLRVPGWLGASQLVAGAPVGYAHSEAGAVDAATNYQRLLVGPLLATPPRYREAERVIFAPAARDKLMATTEQVLAGLQEQTQLLSNASKGVPVALIAVPVSYRLDSYDGNHAAVSLWWVWVVGQQGAMVPIQAWVTSIVTLAWLGDWRIEAIDSANTPVPVLTQDVTQSKDLPEQMHGYREYGHVSG
ncbi:MAG TPA: hypothetical protein VLW53_05060 [Candidatus Eisenbacteria bacterium]|nr:hypothetical protein [Candidatus Eisenbacteria bacterium]